MDPRCGTNAGYQVHHRRNEESCADCRRAHADYCSPNRKGLYVSAYDRQQQAAERDQAAAEAKGRRRRKLREMGIDPDHEEEVRKDHDGLCDICGRPPVRGRRLAADHDHNHQGRLAPVRGFLCVRCNMGLGCFKDRPQLLRLAAEYLEEQW